jgi:hypothetical protein
MLDTKIRSLQSLCLYTEERFNSDVFQLITIEGEDDQDQFLKLENISKHIIKKYGDQIRLFIAYNPHELGDYLSLEILETDFQNNRNIEGFVFQIAEELGYEF